jgi:hypothetical protein
MISSTHVLGRRKEWSDDYMILAPHDPCADWREGGYKVSCTYLHLLSLTIDSPKYAKHNYENMYVLRFFCLVARI